MFISVRNYKWKVYWLYHKGVDRIQRKLHKMFGDSNLWDICPFFSRWTTTMFILNVIVREVDGEFQSPNQMLSVSEEHLTLQSGVKNVVSIILLFIMCFQFVTSAARYPTMCTSAHIWGTIAVTLLLNHCKIFLPFWSHLLQYSPSYGFCAWLERRKDLVSKSLISYYF